MTLDLMTPSELPRLWKWVKDNPKLHSDDAGPKTFEEFVIHLSNEGITLLAARSTQGSLLGAIGVKVSADEAWIRGIHFDEFVRGTAVPWTAVKGVLKMLEPLPVRLRFFADNPYMPGFIKKFKAAGVPTLAGSTIRDGEAVEVLQVEFENAGNLLTTDLRLPAN